ncbi:hypothetical protein CS0771_58880 [Catellatospora sp. IY07-71]|uniref:hypothetical protein n=1 Tax=Catellatospora sp. IY07-71 TaxID=2728827 RepID=UPI001BB441ED|nr:hypothetical protein [Catellatospora sp. IY07-71]BCJ76344.1 hypothetical protein CS0771_58880 [Catellatospora sp. IY07-71]
MEATEQRVPTDKWRTLPARVEPSELVETVDTSPQVEEIEVVNIGQECIRITHG